MSRNDTRYPVVTTAAVAKHIDVPLNINSRVQPQTKAASTVAAANFVVAASPQRPSRDWAHVIILLYHSQKLQFIIDPGFQTDTYTLLLPIDAGQPVATQHVRRLLTSGNIDRLTFTTPVDNSICLLVGWQKAKKVPALRPCCSLKEGGDANQPFE